MTNEIQKLISKREDNKWEWIVKLADKLMDEFLDDLKHLNTQPVEQEAPSDWIEKARSQYRVWPHLITDFKKAILDNIPTENTPVEKIEGKLVGIENHTCWSINYNSTVCDICWKHYRVD